MESVPAMDEVPKSHVVDEPAEVGSPSPMGSTKVPSLNNEKGDIIDDEKPDFPQGSKDEMEYPSGTKLTIIMVGLCMAVFLVALVCHIYFVQSSKF